MGPEGNYIIYNFRRNILADAWQHIDVTSDKFKEIQKRIESSISSVNPHEEYREFTEKNKYVRWPDLVFTPVQSGLFVYLSAVVACLLLY